MADINIRNEIKAEIAKSGWTLTDIVKEMINDGYSATNAIDFQKAIKAYGFNAINSSGVANISNSQT